MPTSTIRPPNQSPQAVALFNALYELYLDAGKPSLRTIARECGQGVISYNTVHKVLSGPGLPKYGHLEVVVAQLSGDNEDTIKHFKKLWTEAQRAEDLYHDNRAGNPNDNADMGNDEIEELRLRLAEILRERDQLTAERDRLAAAEEVSRNHVAQQEGEIEELRLRLAEILRERNQLTAERDRLAATAANGETSNRKWWSTALDTFTFGERLT